MYVDGRSTIYRSRVLHTKEWYVLHSYSLSFTFIVFCVGGLKGSTEGGVRHYRSFVRDLESWLDLLIYMT